MEQLGKRQITPLGLVKASWKHGSFVYVFLAMFIVYLILLPSIRIGSIMNILTHTAVIGTIALGMGLIIISGEIDLSVGSVFAFSGGLGILGYNKILETTNGNHSLAMVGTLFIILGLATILGFINGFMVGKMKLPAFIGTLGTMLILRSLSKFILKSIPTSSGQQQQTYQVDHYFDSPFFKLGNDKVWVIPIVGIILVVLTIIVWYFAKYTKFGRKIYALGSNKKASSLAGINVPWTKVAIFTIAGFLIGIASFLHIGIYGSVDSNTSGMSYELYAIASCVIGGIAMTGGRGNIIGILFGALAFQIIDKIIAVAGLNPLINDTIKGGILLLAVILQVTVINKAAIIKWLQKVGIIFNPHMDEVLESEQRIKVNKTKLAFDKKINAILKSNIDDETADASINELLDQREEIILGINADYELKIDNAKIKIAEHDREAAIKELISTSKDEIAKYKKQLKDEYKTIVKNDPELIRKHLEAKLELSDKYFNKANEILEEVFNKRVDVELLKDNAKHILDRDSKNNAEAANTIYEAKLAKIESYVTTYTAKHDQAVERLATLRDKLIETTNAAIATNEPLEEQQKLLNDEIVEARKIKAEATEAAKAEKEEAKRVKLEKAAENSQLKADEETRRKDKLDSIYKNRGMH